MERRNTMHILLIYLFVLWDQAFTVQEAQFEVCDLESFTARCPYSQQIIITKAWYGHIQLGKCIKMDLGYFGCYADVSNIVHERCSGKQRCEIKMPDAEIKETNPCPSGLVTYLESSYACIPDTIDISCNGLQSTRKVQYITSKQIFKAKCSKGNNQVSFHTDDHLHIKFTLERLHLGGKNSTGVAGSFLFGNGKNISLSFSDEDIRQEQIVYGSTVDLWLPSEDNIILIGYQAIGCEMLQPPAYTWMERDGDITNIGCHNNQHTWQLKCVGSQWIGSVGNCTEKKVIVEVPEHVESEAPETSDIKEELFSREIMYALVIGITVFLCVVVITVGYVSLKRARYQAKAQNSTELQTIVYDDSNTNSWTRGTIGNGKPQQPSNPNSWQPTLMKPLVNVQNGNLTTKSQKYYVVDQDYVNASGFPNA